MQVNPKISEVSPNLISYCGDGKLKDKCDCWLIRQHSPRILAYCYSTMSIFAAVAMFFPFVFLMKLNSVNAFSKLTSLQSINVIRSQKTRYNQPNKPFEIGCESIWKELEQKFNSLSISKTFLPISAQKMLTNDDDHWIDDVTNMPSWLNRFDTYDVREQDAEKVAMEYLLALRQTLLRYHVDSDTNNNKSSIQVHRSENKKNVEKITEFSTQDIDDIINAVVIASKRDWNKVCGASEFILLLLSIQEGEEEHLGKVKRISYFSQHNHKAEQKQKNNEKYSLISRHTLIASAFHYCDCINARQSGVYDTIQKAVKTTELSLTDDINSHSMKYKSSSLPILLTDSYTETTQTNRIATMEVTDRNFFEESQSMNKHEIMIRRYQTKVLRKIGNRSIEPSKSLKSGVEQFGDTPRKIALQAARMKRAEVMADIIIGKNEGNREYSTLDFKSQVPAYMLQRSRNQNIHNLLLSISDEWSALAIRSAASMYRLQGILKHKYERNRIQSYSSDFDIMSANEKSNFPLSPWEVKIAREALYVYAPLAQRLGMLHLKSKLENTAFRTLYPRQYFTALKLYYNSDGNKSTQKTRGEMMQSVADVVTRKLEAIFSADDILLNQLESIEVTSRVKEPYSLWKKMLKLRVKEVEDYKALGKMKMMVTEKKSENDELDDILTSSSIYESSSNVISSSLDQEQAMESTRPILSVPDTIALRVVLNLVESPDVENNEVQQSRERLLCYYTQKLCTGIWPPTDEDRIKDYIMFPKGNGYQSLHYTAGLFRYGEYWPFEVQVSDLHFVYQLHILCNVIL